MEEIIKMNKRIWSLVSLMILVVLLISACGGGAAATPASQAAATPTAAAEATTAPTTEAAANTSGGALGDPKDVALKAAGGQQLGGTLNILGVWGGSELDSFLAVVKPFEDAT